MVGNGAICAFRVGEWEWAGAKLDEWSALSLRIRPAVGVLHEPGRPAVHAQARTELADISGGQAEQRWWARTRSGGRWYQLWAMAWAAFVEGRYDEVRRWDTRIELFVFFAPLSIFPLRDPDALGQTQ